MTCDHEREVERLRGVCEDWGRNYQSWVDATHAAEARVADHEAQIRDLVEEREELLTEIRRLRMGNHPAGRALPGYPRPTDHLVSVTDANVIALAEALTERDAEHEGGGGA